MKKLVMLEDTHIVRSTYIVEIDDSAKIEVQFDKLRPLHTMKSEPILVQRPVREDEFVQLVDIFRPEFANMTPNEKEQFVNKISVEV
jgi:hypothetical protein